jgi:hypothetical protein
MKLTSIWNSEVGSCISFMSSVLRIRLSATFWILHRLIKYVTSLATLMQNELACAINIRRYMYERRMERRQLFERLCGLLETHLTSPHLAEELR